MMSFAIPPDSPLVEGKSARGEVFSYAHATIIVGMHASAITALWIASWTVAAAAAIAHVIILYGGAVIGYHRLLSHKVFRAPCWLVYVFATLGTLTFQGGPLLWVATHRVHHRQTDEFGDAHASSRGFWWSHVGWTFFKNPNGFYYVQSKDVIRDLLPSRYLRWLDRYSTAVNLGAMAVFAVLVRRWDLILWVFPLRIVVGWHFTWLINSYAHFAPLHGAKIGYRIRNSWLVTLLMFGEGWHANHHTHPGRANNGIRPWEIDPAFGVMRLMHSIGLITLRREEPQSESASAPR